MTSVELAIADACARYGAPDMFNAANFSAAFEKQAHPEIGRVGALDGRVVRMTLPEPISGEPDKRAMVAEIEKRIAELEKSDV